MLARRLHRSFPELSQVTEDGWEQISAAHMKSESKIVDDQLRKFNPDWSPPFSE